CVNTPLKKRGKSKKLTAAQSRGLIYIAHIPYGLYENEMKSYFKQFGVITNVKIYRSRKNGNSKGYGYIEFLHNDFAKAAAETMNKYIIFKKRIIAEYVPFEKRPRGLFKGKSTTPIRYSSKVRRDKDIAAIIKVDSTTRLTRSKSRLLRLAKKMQKLSTAEIDNKVRPTDSPDGIKQERVSEDDETAPCEPDTSSKSEGTTASIGNNLLLRKSLDSVKTLLSPKSSSKMGNLTSFIKKVNKATSNPKLKEKGKRDKPKGIVKKKKKTTFLDSKMIRTIARELVRQRGEFVFKCGQHTAKKVCVV
ncbi:hypothetical protein NQ317_007849, partial [Molorchus minor]